jgi:hypothetical protein
VHYVCHFEWWEVQYIDINHLRVVFYLV